MFIVSQIPPVEPQIPMIPMEIPTIVAKLTPPGPMSDISADLPPVRAKLMAIHVDFVAIPTQFPPLMHFHPSLAQSAVRGDRLGVELMANRQNEHGGQAEGQASHRFLSVMSESLVQPNHARKTQGRALR
ncbi:MAG TPA: hypothetical protein VLK88_04095 [Gemmatimonadales bacterium]|nr:hypothetical protein [Gemmatimonadales bacterium]